MSVKTKTSFAKLGIYLSLFLYLNICSVFASDNVVSRPSGFIRITVPSDDYVLVSIPFKPFDKSINAVLNDQLTGAAIEDQADRIFKWDPIGAEYIKAIKADGVGDVEIDGKWFSSFSPLIASSLTIQPGEGFFVYNCQDKDQILCLAGEIMLDEISTNIISPALNLIGYPYSTAINLEDSMLGSIYDEGMDEIISQELVNVPEKLIVGKGYWYKRQVEDQLIWEEKRPYENIFPADEAPPQITGIEIEDNESTLDVVCTGKNGEKLDIYYKDIGAEDQFKSNKDWQIASLDISTEGSSDIQWTDSNVDQDLFARCYLVGRADIDTDGDGIPDCRETFIYHTDPLKAEGGNLSHEKNRQPDNPITQQQSRQNNGVIYVDAQNGNDEFDGLSRDIKDRAKKYGPKKTIKAALRTACKGNTIVVEEGIYNEKVSVSGVRLTTNGKVVIH